MKRFLGERDDALPPKSSKPSTDCMANGCPLPGGNRITHESSVCCVHDDQSASQWSALTTRIRQREALFHLAMQMTNESSGTSVDGYVEQVLKLHGPEPKAPMPGRLTARSYGAQTRGQLILECRGEQKMPISRHGNCPA